MRSFVKKGIVAVIRTVSASRLWFLPVGVYRYYSCGDGAELPLCLAVKPD